MGRSRVLLFLLLGTFAVRANAEDYVLSIVQVHFKHPENSLAGSIEGNGEGGRRIAAGFGFDPVEANRIELVDQDLQAMKDQLIRLGDKLNAGDRMFFYYAGHGSSLVYQNACVAAVVAADEKLLIMNAFDDFFDGLRDRGVDVVAVFDTCFSGGVTEGVKSRGGQSGAKASNPALRSFYVPNEQCGIPINSAVDAERARKGWKKKARGGGGFTVIATAADNEVAIGNRNLHAGIGTFFLAQCANDHAGGNTVSVQALTSCAQSRLEDYWQSIATDDPPQHYQWAGNPVVRTGQQ